VIFVGAAVLFSWCGASDKTSVPKAERLGNEANVLHQGSVNAEADANAERQKSDAVEVQRQTAKREVARSKQTIVEAENKQRKAQADYDKVRKTVPAINGSDLDARERKLLTDLRELQGN
jgi:hypothetical protein